MGAGGGPNLRAVTSGVDVDVRLRAQPPARVLDMACGTGWSSIAMAQAYPHIIVDGLDLDTTPSAPLAGASSRLAWLIE
jgi:methylase of polypeptide subunit release factors